MGKTKIITIFILEAFLLFWIFAHFFFFEQTMDCTGADIQNESGEDGESEILSPMFTLERRGIYELTVGSVTLIRADAKKENGTGEK